MPIYNLPLKEIDMQETKRYAGLRKTDFNETDLYQACLATQLFSKVMGSWELYDYDNTSGKIGNQQSYYIEGTSIRNHLALATKIIVVAVTIGREIEQAITEKFNEGFYSSAFLMDAAATAVVEGAIDSLEKALEKLMKIDGYRLLSRYSPGYGDWDIHFQPQMLELSQAAKINLSLTSSYMLEPRKSVTAVIGLVPNNVPLDINVHNCSSCQQKNCYARKEITYDKNF